MRQLHEQLGSAEILERELESRLRSAEEGLKPAIMTFVEKLQDCRGVQEDIVEETLNEVEDPEEILSVMRKKMINISQMERSELLGFTKTILYLRDGFLEKDLQDEVDIAQEMASDVLGFLGRSTIRWEDLECWEAEILRRLLRNVEGVPVFMRRMMDCIFRKVSNGQEQHFARTRKDQDKDHDQDQDMDQDQDQEGPGQ